MKHLILRIEDIFTKMTGCTVFSTLDTLQAYQELVLNEELRRLVMVNTHKGLFPYTRLPFGVASAPEIFQRTMENVSHDIPQVGAYQDDILIGGRTETEHLAILEQVLVRLKRAGFRLQRKKCSLITQSVEYLGHRLDAAGLHPTDKK